MSLSVDCRSEVRADSEHYLLASEVRSWIMQLPNGATLAPIIKDFGTQRDPDERLIGLRAEWSEGR